MTKKIESKLMNGSTPAGSTELFARLDDLQIPYQNLEHPAVFTVEEARVLRGKMPGAHSKNLFLRDKKERHWLVSCLSHRTLDLMWLADHLGTKRLTFCSARRLMGYLGITRGAVSPFAVLNDLEGVVRVALDQEMLAREPLNFHPLDNAMTATVSKDGLLTFLEAVGHVPQVVPFPDEEASW